MCKLVYRILDTFSDIINNLLLFKIRKTNEKSCNRESKGARIPQPDTQPAPQPGSSNKD
jgi:hypothetical protein